MKHQYHRAGGELQNSIRQVLQINNQWCQANGEWIDNRRCANGT